eukprot:scaffold104964_cov16-Tisochrysis_lutea.AAC.1
MFVEIRHLCRRAWPAALFLLLLGIAPHRKEQEQRLTDACTPGSCVPVRLLSPRTTPQRFRSPLKKNTHHHRRQQPLPQPHALHLRHAGGGAGLVWGEQMDLREPGAACLPGRQHLQRLVSHHHP